jgi:integrase
VSKSLLISGASPESLLLHPNLCLFCRRIRTSTSRALLAELVPIRKQKAAIINAHGRPYTANSLSNAFRKVFVRIGMDGYSVHGLRKNAAVALAEVGCGPHEIMAITGHKTLAMVTHYTKRANQKRLADRAMEKWKTSKSG